MIRPRGLFRKYIQRRPGQLTGLKRSVQRLLIDQFPARRVD
jgi:hypothetical protein